MKSVTTEDKAFLDAIRVQYDLLAEGFAKGDANIVARQFFTPDAWSVGEGEETAIEADQIEKLYADFVGIYTYTAQSVAPRRVGDAGWDYVEVTLKSTDGSNEIHSYKALYLWQKQGDQWRCVGQMYVEGSFKGSSVEL